MLLCVQYICNYDLRIIFYSILVITRQIEVSIDPLYNFQNRDMLNLKNNQFAILVL